MTSRRILLSCAMVFIIGGAATLGAFAGGTAVFVAAGSQLRPVTANVPVTSSRPVAQPVTQVPAVTVDPNTAVEQAVA